MVRREARRNTASRRQPRETKASTVFLIDRLRRAVNGELACRVALLSIAVAVLFPASTAWACVPCGSGDGVVPDGSFLRGVEGTGRVTAASRFSRWRSDGFDVAESRLAIGAAYAPIDGWLFSAELPLVGRDVVSPSLGRDTTLGLGDASVTARFSFFRDRSWAPTHTLTWSMSVAMPTATMLDADGQRLAIESQPGRGAWGVTSALAWSLAIDDVRAVTTLTGVAPFEGEGAERPGLSLRAGTLVAYQPVAALALLGGVEVRVDGPATLAGLERTSSPWLSLDAQVGAALRFEDLTVVFAVRLPVAAQHRGDYVDRPALDLNVMGDFDVGR